MGQIDLLHSETQYLAMAQQLRSKKLRRAAKLVEEAREIVDDAVRAIVRSRPGFDPSNLRGIQIISDAAGIPTALGWTDPAPPTPAA